MNIAVCCCVISVHGIEPRIHPYYDRKYSWLPLPVTVEEFVTFRIVHQTQITVIPQKLLELTISPESSSVFLLLVLFLEFRACFT